MLTRYEQFSAHISGIYRLIQKLEREELEKQGLKGAYAQYLTAMLRSTEGVTAAQLCDMCDKDKAAVSRVVNEMEEKGIVSRDEQGSAYRSVLRLTEKGRKAAEFVRDRAKVAVNIAGGGLSDSRRRELYAALETVENELRAICRDGIPEERESDR